MDAVRGSWAGDYPCCACRRKRLTAKDFSGKQLDKLRAGKLKLEELRCKICITSAQEAERARASEVRGTVEGNPLVCSVCLKEKLPRFFSNTQARKPDASRKCKDCSANMEMAEMQASEVARGARMRDAQEAVARADKISKGATGAAARLKAASAECALEAEKVTGMRPIMGAGLRGRGGGRGSWRGRGRG
ncbi:unnamed protein product [Choristocarpus tenellus]